MKASADSPIAEATAEAQTATARVQSATPKAAFEAKSSAKKAKPERIVSTKAEADWLRKQLPGLIEGESGRWDVRPDCAGFNVYFRVDKRQNEGEPINLKFPRISREMFTTLKGMNQNERSKTIEKYVRGHIGKGVRRGDDRARIIAGKLRVSS